MIRKEKFQENFQIEISKIFKISSVGSHQSFVKISFSRKMFLIFWRTVNVFFMEY
jgi:hypothetical protein